MKFKFQFAVEIEFQRFPNRIEKPLILNGPRVCFCNSNMIM